MYFNKVPLVSIHDFPPGLLFTLTVPKRRRWKDEKKAREDDLPFTRPGKR